MCSSGSFFIEKKKGLCYIFQCRWGKNDRKRILGFGFNS